MFLYFLSPHRSAIVIWTTIIEGTERLQRHYCARSRALRDPPIQRCRSFSKTHQTPPATTSSPKPKCIHLSIHRHPSAMLHRNERSTQRQYIYLRCYGRQRNTPNLFSISHLNEKELRNKEITLQHTLGRPLPPGRPCAKRNAITGTRLIYLQKKKSSANVSIQCKSMVKPTHIE